MAYIEFRNIKKTYDGETIILKDLDLDVEEGNLVTLLGASGSGKSTLLRCLAGFESISSGTITIDGVDVTNMAPGERQIGMVFQQYSLFPNMTVAENIAFGLKMKKMNKSEINEKVSKMIEMVDLKGRENYYPDNLSGGQKQRVALARAIVTEPRVLLLDEPLSAIDALLRKNLQKAIRRIQQELNVTTIFVTHDQDEAMIMSDVIHIMNKGQIEQSGKPTEIYTHPKTHYVASFIGNYNVLSHKELLDLSGIEMDGEHFAIRPETIDYQHEPYIQDESYVYFTAQVNDSSITGNILSYTLQTDTNVFLKVDELFRSYKLLERGEIINGRVEKRNILAV
ncbi:ABC transporter ATP-binding protein [Aerococcaceae bacterium 50-4]